MILLVARGIEMRANIIKKEVHITSFHITPPPIMNTCMSA